MREISVQQLHQMLYASPHDPDLVVIDIRNPAEYNEAHIEFAQNIPLESLPQKVTLLKNKKVVVHCLSGQRCTKAFCLFAEHEIDAQHLTGGIISWEAAGYPLARASRTRLPVLRQLFLAIALINLAGLLIGLYLDPLGFILVGLVCAGLLVSAATGWCGMLILLQQMPWNRSKS